MLLIFALSFVKSYWPLLKKVIMPPRSRSRTPTYISYSNTGNTLKHAFIHPKFCSCTRSRQKKCLLGKYSMFYKIVISLNMWFKRHGLCKSMKKKKNMDTWRSKKKKRERKNRDTWRSQGIEKKEMSTWRLIIIKKWNDSHVSKQKARERSYLQKEYSTDL